MNNNESPLIPQGSLLEQKNKSRIRVKIAVFFVLAIHGLGLMALLMIGCQKEKEPASQPAVPPAPEVSSTAPTLEPTNQPTLPPAESNPASAASATPSSTPAALPPTTFEPTPTTAPTTSAALPAIGGSEYKVKKGDTLATIAKNSHVGLQALQSANPGVNSSRLKIGQTLQIPTASAATPAPSSSPSVAGPAASEPSATGGQQEYTVKSGDSLTKIASQFKVSIKALRSANSLKVDKIKVGQKLKIPGKPAGSAATPSPTPDSTPAVR